MSGLMCGSTLYDTVLLLSIVAAIVAFNMFREGQLYVSTDNAQLTGQPVQVGAMNAGRVDAILPSIGATVHKGDVIAQVALPSQVGVGQNGQPKMGFLGAGDTHVDGHGGRRVQVEPLAPRDAGRPAIDVDVGDRQLAHVDELVRA